MTQVMVPDAKEKLCAILERQVALDIEVEGNQFCRMCCCQPNMNWTVFEPLDDLDPSADTFEMGKALMKIKESSPWAGRCVSFFCPGGRPTSYTVDDIALHREVMRFQKGCTCGQSCCMVTVSMHPMSWLCGWPIRFPLCCCLPFLSTLDADGVEIGKSQILCDQNFCVPKIAVSVYDKPTYIVYPDTCLYGFCPVCTCDAPGQGSWFLRSPFHIRDLNGNRYEHAAIRDPRSSHQLAKKGWCSRGNLYSLDFPNNATVYEKAALMGAVMLIDISLFEQDTAFLG
eukprot:CAMPEP_0114236920 /NCGR_PEP_ID=MMETSP0058-20121206/7109_1 /TAXON_ID=36894 /ORGANISM="Pyramimonas parkeae, CCMP726" /LENGTH=284 /DNA_ID=CAMNT_0001348917 /DNA_START=222 /DNA_END=1076 /DNA_ORIENTATION=-